MSKFIDFFKRHRIIKHLVLVLLLALVLVMVVFFSLNSYTRQGEQIAVPDLREVPLENAIQMLDNESLTYMVIDSVYRRNSQPGCVVEQTPKAGALVKKDRRIYLTINAKQERLVALPQACDMSVRQARSALEAAGFVISDIQYKPSEYKDLVLEVHCGARKLKEGDALPMQTALQLWVGSGSLTDDIPLDSLSAQDLFDGM